MVARLPSSNSLGREPGDHMRELMCAFSRPEVRTVPRFQAIRASRMRAANLALRLFVVSLLLPAISSAQPNPVRRVLVFHELGLSSPTVGLVAQELRDALANAPYQIELYHEYLETILFPDPVVQQEFREWYIRKYRDRRPDLIIALGPSPLKFLVDSHEEFFLDIPIVFGGAAELEAVRAGEDSGRGFAPSARHPARGVGRRNVAVRSAARSALQRASSELRKQTGFHVLDTRRYDQPP